VAVLSHGSGLVAPDVYALGADGPRRLTRHGAWTDAFAAPRRDEREVPGPAGQISVHLLLPPDGVEPRGTVVSVHGGPVAQWGVVPPLEAVVLAAAGYRVAMPNIRGSIDRDAGWARALAGGWGEADTADVLAVCDDLEADGGVPDGRLGLLGLSYGGFLVQWLIGVTDRFAAAVAENGVANQVAAWGSSDAGPSFSEAARLGSVVSAGGVEQLWACSPLRNVERVRTPLLILQGADDRTCPASDNEQLFVALRALGREVEYVLYPEESHGMQATARLDRRIDRHRRMLTWFDTHLAR
ncbi:MAG: S9 family peptidase, partial [Actinobacteria bacterium]|nr:S9 family peptidase [Actinomycetota bacterium]